MTTGLLKNANLVEKNLEKTQQKESRNAGKNEIKVKL